ncbi:hypothetical protein [Martelella endophytica]|uniref:Uncharacterized protein n=1 Tax=Martelella endophytica TaxID=1486262 RepID=A0A0D5LRX4_MAREN|nr:hypothetical protein [Martelella endophytica]AJY46118.1 hypothetical protein TM49_11225 [Martelella endophytica]
MTTCDIDGVRLIGLHRTDADGGLLCRYAPMRAGAVVLAFPPRRRTSPSARKAAIIDLDLRRRHVHNHPTEVPKCISR